MKRYGTETQCAEALFQARWSSGFQCPVCGGRRYSVVKTRNLYQCSSCHHQTSLISGTLFEQIKLLLIVWFLAIYLYWSSSEAGASYLWGKYAWGQFFSDGMQTELQKIADLVKVRAVRAF